MAKTPKITTPSPFPVTLPGLVVTACEESAVGKTTFATVLADVLTLAGHPFVAFQSDTKPRLREMLGSIVTDLRPDPDRLLNEPALLRTAFTPLHTAYLQIARTGATVEFDTGAKDIPNIANFLIDVEFDADLREHGYPMLIFIVVQADPEAIEGAAMTWRALRQAVPSAHLVLVENAFDRGTIAGMKPTSPARRKYEAELQPLVDSAPHLVMPAMVTEFWQPFEETGTRFIRVMAMSAAEGAERFGMEVGDFKIARGNITRFFQAVQSELARVIVLPEGGR